MSKRALLFGIGAALLLVVGGSLLLRGSSPKAMSGMHMSDTSQMAASTDNIKIADFAFQPMTITVNVGTKVTWTNQDSTPHSIVADNQSVQTAVALKSLQLNQGQSYSFTFTKPGTYTYHCVPHVGMHGTVIATN